MKGKINVAVLNVLILVIFVVTFILVIIIEAATYLANPPTTPLAIWTLDGDIPLWNMEGIAKLTSAIVSILAAVFFFIIARKYNIIRKSKEDKALASMVYFSLVYQGIARLFEAFFILSTSSLSGIVFSIGKYYIVLDLLAMILFLMVTSQVFLVDEFKEGTRFPACLDGIGISGFVLGILALFLNYISDRSIRWIVGGASIVILLIITIILVVVCTRIFSLYKRMQDQENRGAIFIIGIQLILLVITMSLLIYSEIGSGDARSYFLRAARAGILMVIAYLYVFSFITPAAKQKKRHDTN
jgi:hypothetical protein